MPIDQAERDLIVLAAEDLLQLVANLKAKAETGSPLQISLAAASVAHKAVTVTLSAISEASDT